MSRVDDEVEAVRPASVLSDELPDGNAAFWESAEAVPRFALVGRRIAAMASRCSWPQLGSYPSQTCRMFIAKLGVATIVAVLAITLFPGPRPSANLIAERISTSTGEVSSRDANARDTVRAESADLLTPATISLASGNGPSRGPVPFVIDLVDLTVADSALTVDEGEWVEPELEAEGQWIDGGNGVLLPEVLLRIRFCESTNNYTAAHVNSTARGAYQFLTSSWQWYGHAERFGVPEADLAAPAQQDEAALHTLDAQGARPWAESRACWDDENIDPRYLTAGPPPTSATTTTAPSSTTTSQVTSTTATPTTTTAPPTTTTTTTTTAPSTTATTVSTTSTPPSTTASTTTSTEP